MTGRRFSSSPYLPALAVGLLISSAQAEQTRAVEKRGRAGAAPNAAPNVVPRPAPAPGPPAPKPQAPRPNQGQAANPNGNAPTRPDNHPGEQMVDRLMKMTPQQREKALESFPPQRRQNIQKRLDVLQKMPPAVVDRIRNRQEMLNNLPPQRQIQVKRSVQQFLAMPEERRGAINRELQKISPLPDEDRRAYMNTEEFRNKYTAHEQQMMSHLSEITPAPQP